MNWAELPAKVKIYLFVLCGFAVVAFASALGALARSPFNSGCFVLTLLVAVDGLFYLFLPSVNTLVGIGDAYVMAIAMMYGVFPCIIATFLQTLIISICGQRPKRYSYKTVFNTASSVCGAWIYASVYHLLNPSLGHHAREIIVPAAILVATFFLVNSMLTSIAIAWSRQDNILKFWAKVCMPLAFDYSVSSVCAAIIVTVSNVNEYIPFAIAPFLGVVWGWTKLHKSRLLQAEKHLEEQEQLYLRTVESLALAVDAKDQTTYGHIRRVKTYAMGLADLCGIRDQSELKAIETGSLLHDIGKIAVEDYILNKPGRLSKNEYEKVKMHAAAGDEILQQVCFPFPVAKYVRYHHERWDGLGYPDGLKGEAIPLGARILAIADAFDAIRFSRPYKLSVPTDEAIEILRAEAGIVYDPALVQVFTSHIEELERAALKESENAPKLSFRRHTEKTDDAFSSEASDSPTPSNISAELVQLAELCSTVSGCLRLNDIFPIVARRLQPLVPFNTCIFYVKNSDDLVEASYVGGSFSKLLQDHVIETGKGISGWVAAYRKPMINANPSLDFQGIGGDLTSLTAAVVVPIIQEGESLGTISLYAQEPISYGPNDVSNLQALAGLLAPLISEDVRNGSSGSQDVIDPITGIHRISYLTAFGPQLISSAGNSRAPISLICIDVRNLAQIVRVFGLNLGNLILKSVADCIKPELRETDILVRYGQSGFVAFLPGVRSDQAIRCTERLRRQISNQALTPGQGFTIDCQIGISYFPKDGSTIFALLQSAQENMRAEYARKPASESNVIDFRRT